MIRNLVSVIVPVYNGEEYIETCITELEHQIYRPIEIILVDDGSTDQSPMICDALKEWYDNITVIHQSNQGVSSARNTALDVAKGEWIAFCDADDFMMPTMLDTLINDVVRTKADISCCGYFRFPHETKCNGISNKRVEVLDKVQMFHAVISRNDCNGYLCNKLFKSEKLNTAPAIRFDSQIAIHEDEFFILQYLERCNSMCFNPAQLYGYRESAASATKQKYTDRAFTALVARERIYNLVVKSCSDEEVIKSVWNNMMLNFAVFNVRLIRSDLKNRDQWNKVIKTGFAAHRKKYRLDSRWGIKVKFYYFLLNISL